MRMRVALALLVVLLAAPLAFLAWVLMSLDLERLKGLLAEEIQAVTGREAHLDGAITLEFGLIPTIVVERASLANAGWGSRPQMASIRRIEAGVALFPLFMRQVRISRLDLDGLDLLLEVNRQGRGNWEFRPEQPAGTGEFALDIHRLGLRNATVTFNDAQGATRKTLALARLVLKPAGASRHDLIVSGIADGTPFSADGAIGPLTALLDNTPLALDLEGRIGGAEIKAVGSVRQPLDLGGLDVALVLAGEDAAAVPGFAAIAPAALSDPGPFRVTARLADTGKTMELADIDATLGRRERFVFTATGRIADIRAGTGFDLQATLHSDETARAVAAFGGEIAALGPLRLEGRLADTAQGWRISALSGRVGSARLAGEVEVATVGRMLVSGKLGIDAIALSPAPAASDGRLFSAAPLPLDGLTALDLDLSLSIGRLSLGTLRAEPLEANLRLDRGRLAVRDVGAGFLNGSVGGRIDIDARAPIADIRLHLDGAGIDLGGLVGGSILTGGPMAIRLDFQGKGASMRELMAGAGGAMVASIGEGRLANRAIDWIGGDILFEVLGSLDPAAGKGGETALHCAVLRLAAKDGIATIDKGLAFETGGVNVVGSGTIDLAKETLDLGLAPSPRKGLGLTLGGALAGLTRVEGTLLRPQIAIDGLGAARTAASIGAAVATSGLSFLGELLLDRVVSDPSPCRTALAGPGGAG